MRNIDRLNLSIVFATVMFVGGNYLTDMSLAKENEHLKVKVAVYLQTIKYYEKEFNTGRKSK